MAVATAVGSVGRANGPMAVTENKPAGQQTSVFNETDEQRARFAAGHGVADPGALAAAVRHSTMANLLVSVAIEESRGDPVAVGSAGERGAWQVKASFWGAVPPDLPGQAGQAENIIGTLLIQTGGDRRKALARYNGGISPPVRSYRYAERVLKRARYLQAVVNRFPPGYHLLRQALLEPPRTSRIL